MSAKAFQFTMNGEEEREFTLLNDLLSKITAIKQTITGLSDSNQKHFDTISSISDKWVEKRETFERQKLDIELALDVVHDVDHKTRDIITHLSSGLEEQDAEYYIQNINYGRQLLAKSREASRGLNPRMEEVYAALEEAIGFAVGELKRFYPRELGRAEQNQARLKLMDAVFKGVGYTDHYYEIVKLFGSSWESQSKSMEGVLTVCSSLERFSKELEALIIDAAVVAKVRRNVYRQFSKYVFDNHLKLFLTKFNEVDIKEKVLFLSQVDKCYAIFKEREAKQDEDILLNMISNFYFGVLDYVLSFMQALEKSVDKPEQALESLCKTMIDLLSLLDTNAGSFSVFIRKKNMEATDSIDLAYKISECFVKVLKKKSDLTKEKSILQSHLLTLRMLEEVVQAMQSWKKVSLKLRPAFEKSMVRATESYLTYCWGHVLAHKHSTEGLKEKQQLLKAYFETFQKYEQNLEKVVEMHRKYPGQLGLQLRDKLRKEHLRKVYPGYHKVLTEFLLLEIEDKQKYFKYYANDFEKEINKRLLV